MKYRAFEYRLAKRKLYRMEVELIRKWFDSLYGARSNPFWRFNGEK